MTYYGTRTNFGCRFGRPHDMRRIKDTPQMIVERCANCPKQFRWPKGYKGRVKNVEYLRAHIRSFAQRIGATRRVFMKLYEPEKTTIII